MQWDLLPPLVFKSSRVTVAGLLEPAYDVGGDCFDYALNGPLLSIALMDAMGHGLNSAVLSSLAVGCYRHDRREGQTLVSTHHDLDTTIGTRYRGDGFVTGQLAQLDVDTGSLDWTNAGHPLPLLIRRGRVIGQLECTPTVPWGLGEESAVHPVVAQEALEPDDSVLFFTDGWSRPVPLGVSTSALTGWRTSPRRRRQTTSHPRRSSGISSERSWSTTSTPLPTTRP
jgi:serine phosphatase RsbU (regulator of sigma subunit)